LELWNRLIDLSREIETIFDEDYECTGIMEIFGGWRDKTWNSELVRKCHLKTIDNRQSQKLWLMHINIFPREAYDFPILGFDIVSGPNKITGSFFDLSPVSQDDPPHPYLLHMKEAVENLSWSKPRELPDWAVEIFSKNMIAAGNLRTDEEVQQLCDTCLHLVRYYVKNMKESARLGDPESIREYHNKYCRNQKLNPHLHRSILSMGISEEDKNDYVNRILFEEI